MSIFLKNINLKSFFAGAILFPFLYACAVPFGPNDPVIGVGIEAHKDKYRGVTTQADRRLVLATKKEEEEITMVGPGEKESTTRKIPAMPIICAEPFPEGVALLDKLKKTTLELNDKALGLEDKHTFNVSIPFASHPAIKFYRDGIFALCQAAMNGWVETKPQVRISANSQVIGFKRWEEITKDDQTTNKDTNFYLNNNSLVIKIIESSMELDENEKEFLIELMEETRPGGRTRERLKLTAPPFISEFEFQLYRLREAAIRIFSFEAEKEKAKAQQEEAKAQQEEAKAQQEIAKARQEESKAKQILYQKCNTNCENCIINCVDPD